MGPLAASVSAGAAVLFGHMASMPDVSSFNAANPCLYNSGNATFNFDGLNIGGFWSVQDSRNNPGSLNYTYFFNVCGDTASTPYPNVCTTTYAGTNGHGGPSGLPNTGPAPAYQVANFAVPPGDECHRLGGSVGYPGNVSYGLYDITNPSLGAYIQYLNGDRCGSKRDSQGKPIYRSMRVWMRCYTDAVGIPPTEVVLETDGCLYDIYVNSIFGCPVECAAVKDSVTGDFNLCNKHGVCDFDGVLGHSRCFCNPGWEGSDCSVQTVVTTGLSPVGGVLIAVGIFLAFTLAFLVFLWYRIKALRLDPSAYSVLRSGPTGDHELGAVKAI